MADASESRDGSDTSSDLYDPPSPFRREAESSPVSLKRKHEDSDQDQDRAVKKLKPAASLSRDLWLQVFRHCPPAILGRLLRVCKLFQSYLTYEAPSEDDVTTQTSTPNPIENVWKVARLSRYPGMPETPLDLPEQSLWRLLKSRKCQTCDSADAQVVYSFRAKLCKKCLKAGTQAEAALFMSAFSALLPLLPFAFLTSDDNILPTVSLENRSSLGGLQLQKIYLTADMESIQVKLNRARQDGDQAVKACFQSLTDRKDELMRSVRLWEQWDESGGRQSLEFRSPVSSPTTSSIVSDVDTDADARNDSAAMPPPTSRSASVAQTNGQRHVDRRTDSASRQRDRQDVQEMRAARRADIEQRCLALETPIQAHLLPHMESFQAALQITNPLTDAAWDMLKPRLVAQLAEAQRREAERLIAEEKAHVEAAERRHQEEVLREIKDTADKNWNDCQKPVKELLGKHADEVLRDQWASGAAVNEHNKASFAAQLLIEVRARFYADPTHIQVIIANTVSGAPPQLVLDNMKWLYDNKVKPITDPLGGAFFVCNGCHESKFKALDGVVQHYASKHTSAFSSGKTIVSWQSAPWPETPPFKPDPSSPDLRRFDKQAYPTSRTPSHSTSLQQEQHLVHQPHVFAAPQPERALTIPQPYGLSPAPYGSPVAPPPYLANSGPQYPGAPAPAQAASSGQVPPGQMPSGQYGQPFPLQPFHSTGYSGPGSPFAGQSPYYGPPAGPGPQTPASSGNPFAAPINMPNAFPPMWHPVTSLYQSQKNVVADIARDLWSLLSPLSSVPMSVRVYVIIHHVVSRFHQRFSNEPNLDLFADSINTNPLLKSLKGAANVGCKQCELQNQEKEQEATGSSSMPPGVVELYPFHSLLTHFKHVHIEYQMLNNRPQDGGPSVRLDWKEDMVSLPKDDYVRTLWNAQGMDQHRLDLIAEFVPLIKLDAPSNGRRAFQASHQRVPHENASFATAAWPAAEPDRRDNEYDPRQPVMINPESHTAGRSSGRRSGGGYHEPRAAPRDAGRQSHTTTPGSTSDTVRHSNSGTHSALASTGPSPVDTVAPRPKPRHSASPDHPPMPRAGPPHEGYPSNYDTATYGPRPPDQSRRPYREYAEFVEGPGPRHATFVERIPGRPVYSEQDRTYYDRPPDDDVEYVVVRRREAPRVVEYPDDRYYQYVRR